MSLDYLKSFGRFLYEVNNRDDTESAKQVLRETLEKKPNYLGQMKKDIIISLKDKNRRLKDCVHRQKYRREFRRNLKVIEVIIKEQVST